MKIASFLDALFPKGITCNGCGKELDKKDEYFSLCPDCAKNMYRVQSPVKIDELVVHSVFDYEGLVRKYVLDYKDSDKPYLCEFMAKYMYAYCQERGLTADTICYVPSSPAAIKRRGYDGMEIIAEELSRLTGIKLDKSLFRRDGLDQTKVAHEKRMQNVHNKFLSRSGFSGTVLLIDDVVTTGATVNECAEVIKSHGADDVIVLSFAAARSK